MQVVYVKAGWLAQHEHNTSTNNAKTLFSTIQEIFSQRLLLAFLAVVQTRVSVLARPRVQVGANTVVGHHTSLATVAIKIFTELAVR